MAASQEERKTKKVVTEEVTFPLAPLVPPETSDKLNPSVFGPIYWFSLFTFAYLYEAWDKNLTKWIQSQIAVSTPTSTHTHKWQVFLLAKSALMQLFERWYTYALWHIPCSICRFHAQEWIKKQPLNFETYDTLYDSLFLLHQSVSIRVGKEDAKNWTKKTWLAGIRQHFKEFNFTVLYVPTLTPRTGERMESYQIRDQENADAINSALYWLHFPCEMAQQQAIQPVSEGASITEYNKDQNKQQQSGWNSTSDMVDFEVENMRDMLKDYQKESALYSLQFKVNMNLVQLNQTVKEQARFLMKLTQPKSNKIPLWGRFVFLEHVEILLQRLDVLFEQNTNSTIHEPQKFVKWIQLSALLLFPKVSWNRLEEILKPKITQPQPQLQPQLRTFISSLTPVSPSFAQQKTDYKFSITDSRYWYQKFVEFGLESLDPEMAHYAQSATISKMKTRQEQEQEQEQEQTQLSFSVSSPRINGKEKKKEGDQSAKRKPSHEIFAKSGWKHIVAKEWTMESFELKKKIRSKSNRCQILPFRGVAIIEQLQKRKERREKKKERKEKAKEKEKREEIKDKNKTGEIEKIQQEQERKVKTSVDLAKEKSGISQPQPKPPKSNNTTCQNENENKSEKKRGRTEEEIMGEQGVRIDLPQHDRTSTQMQTRYISFLVGVVGSFFLWCLIILGLFRWAYSKSHLGHDLNE